MSTLQLATDRMPSKADFDRLTWMNIHEAAFYLRKTPNALRLMVSKGYIKPRKLGNRLYFRKIEIDRLLESSLTY